MLQIKTIALLDWFAAKRKGICLVDLRKLNDYTEIITLTCSWIYTNIANWYFYSIIAYLYDCFCFREQPWERTLLKADMPASARKAGAGALEPGWPTSVCTGGQTGCWQSAEPCKAGFWTACAQLAVVELLWFLCIETTVRSAVSEASLCKEVLGSGSTESSFGHRRAGTALLWDMW